MIQFLAYGWRLHPCVMRHDFPEAKLLGKLRLAGYRLSFRVSAPDGSAWSDMEYTGNPWDTLYGAVYGLSDKDKDLLDLAEARGDGYDQMTLNLIPGEPGLITYRGEPDRLCEGALPWDWYRNIIDAGVRYLGFPYRYRQHLATQATKRDVNTYRVQEARLLMAEIQTYGRSPEWERSLLEA